MWKPEGLLNAEEIATEFRLKYISVEWGACENNTEEKLSQLLRQVWINGAKAAFKVCHEKNKELTSDEKIIPEFGMDKGNCYSFSSSIPDLYFNSYDSLM